MILGIMLMQPHHAECILQYIYALDGSAADANFSALISELAVIATFSNFANVAGVGGRGSTSGTTPSCVLCTPGRKKRKCLCH
jgi:hypothetical protein